MLRVEIRHFAATAATFNLSQLRLVPPFGVTPCEFRRCLRQQTTRVTGLSRGVVCVIL